MVQRRPRYIFRLIPRVYGNWPGSPRSRSYSSGSLFEGLKSTGSSMPDEVVKCSRRSVFVLVAILLKRNEGYQAKVQSSTFSTFANEVSTGSGSDRVNCRQSRFWIRCDPVATAPGGF